MVTCRPPHSNASLCRSSALPSDQVDDRASAMSPIPDPPILNCKLILIGESDLTHPRVVTAAFLTRGLAGNSSVGKSSLLLRFADEQWLPEDEANATIGVDFRVS